MMKKNLKSKNGFTLVEVLVVLMILGFLASIAFPQFSKVIANSQKRADETNIRIIESAIEVYRIEEGDYPSAETFDALITELKTKEYIRQTKIESADKEHFRFKYDSSNHLIEREEITTAG